jgi:hypothetical protein
MRIAVYIAVLTAAFLVFYQTGLIKALPIEEALTQWDAGWYEIIKDRGIYFLEDEQCSAGFFPTFAFLWKWSGLNALSISLLNLLLCATGMYLLHRTFRFPLRDLLLALSFPAMFYFYLPYTESLFFLCGCVLLAGLHSSKDLTTVAGAGLASVVRPSMLFLVPSFLFTWIVTSKKPFSKKETADEQEEFIQRSLHPYRILFYGLLACAGGVAIIVLYQWLETGTWFAYFKAQSIAWDRAFRFPRMPFVMPYGADIHWLDATAFMAGMAALTGCCVVFYKARFGKTSSPDVPQAVLFSMAFVLSGFFSVIFFNPYHHVHHSTTASLNRHVFTNPFFFVLLAYTADKRLPNYINPATTVALALLVVFMSGLFSLPWMYPLLFVGYVLLVYYYLHLKQEALYWTLLVINLLLQVWYFGQFLEGRWVG